MALVELYRETGVEDYLVQARLFIERRGRGHLDRGTAPGEYFQDNAPFRELPAVTGHAVRMAYLAAGAADVHVETGDASLFTALERLWDDMVATKLYVTGGLGSRHSDEAIGDRYELPSERAYTETCAAIATMQWAWRMFLASGAAKYLDVFETVLYNAYAVGLSAAGTAFFYDNPLQRRPDHEQRSGAESGGEPLRRSWFGCPCCPPNIVRWMAQLQDYLAAEQDGTLYVGQYADARITAANLAITISTAYPWDGDVTITVDRAPEGEFGLALRIPAWAAGATVTVNGAALNLEPSQGWLTVQRQFVAGDEVRLALPMPPRAHGSHPYLDATRGALAVARGPLVYCVEQQDVAAAVDDLLVGPVQVAEARVVPAEVVDGTPGQVVLEVTAGVAPTPAGELYPVLTEAPSPPARTHQCRQGSFPTSSGATVRPGRCGSGCGSRDTTTWGSSGPRTERRQMKRSTMLVGLALSGTLVLTACSGNATGSAQAPAGPGAKPAQGGVVQVLANAGFSHLDPARGFDGGVNNFYRLIYRTLTTQGAAPGAEGTKIVPDLATDTGRPSDGGKTWTFTLKDGLFFETGAPITSADVKFGVSRAWDPELGIGSPYAKQIIDAPASYQGPYKSGGLATIATPDAKTIVFHLKKPYADFGSVVAQNTFVPVPAGQRGRQPARHQADRVRAVQGRGVQARRRTETGPQRQVGCEDGHRQGGEAGRVPVDVRARRRHDRRADDRRPGHRCRRDRRHDPGRHGGPGPDPAAQATDPVRPRRLYDVHGSEHDQEATG